jgi:predicted RNA-binding Zn-ribbon protein involved in translation (DUF1610 family)
MLEPEARGTTPPHWTCANCYGERRISVIQHSTKRGEGNLYVCPACGASIEPSREAFEEVTGRCKWLD